ncbi:MAG: malto-oligosyltrehalose trehalohydrolase [Betaproteobacteria bacterium]|nr:malto-oligosyltrehalose trehalohydrolase [Betaproteobacteria bacterium]
MPFGAATCADGSTRFRLWAPGAERVELILSGGTSIGAAAMEAESDGWYQADVIGAGAGVRYAFRINGALTVPDPASRFNPGDVHAPSMVIDPLDFAWEDGEWRGRPWSEAAIYELHVGTFTAAGTFAAAAERLDYLADLGVTAIELMPVADFPGRRNWGYDGVLLFAPDSSYGAPEDLKRLVQAAHARDLVMLLDVVYNHFGPEGNYLHAYAPQFFNERHHTPWGAAINFDGEGARTARDFFIHNALYWLEEYHFDGLRLDAVHAIADDSRPHIVEELSRAVREGPGRKRQIHIVIENDRNESRYLGRDALQVPNHATAQWNDDAHHAFHILLSGERDGYYSDYADRPRWFLGRSLAEGFGYQGEISGYRGDVARGEPCTHLPAAAFVNFLQSHDQVGNRAFGERIGALAPPRAVDAAVACLLLAPPPPLLFMGEEFDASALFLYFCDFGAELAVSVAAGRREEFGRFERFRDAQAREAIPDPNDPATFERSKLDWSEAVSSGTHAARHRLYRKLLALRREHLAPRLLGMTKSGTFECIEPGGLAVHWVLGDGARWHLVANLGDAPSSLPLPAGWVIYASDPMPERTPPHAALAPWFVAWFMEDGHG